MEWRIILLVLPTLFALTCGSPGMMTGGREKINIHDHDKEHEFVLEGLKEAVKENNKRSNCMFLYKAQVEEAAEVQVVQGLLYTVNVITDKTPCKTVSDPEFCICVEDPNMVEPYSCKFRVWIRQWLEDKDKMIVFQKCPEDEDWKTLNV